MTEYSEVNNNNKIKMKRNTAQFHYDFLKVLPRRIEINIFNKKKKHSKCSKKKNKIKEISRSAQLSSVN